MSLSDEILLLAIANGVLVIGLAPHRHVWSLSVLRPFGFVISIGAFVLIQQAARDGNDAEDDENHDGYHTC